MTKGTKAKSSLEERDSIIENYRNLFSTPLGQKVLGDMKKSLGYGKTVYTEKSSNQDLAFHLGRQSVVNKIIEIIESK